MWNFIDLIENEFVYHSKSYNKNHIINHYEEMLKKVFTLLQKLSEKSKNLKLICIYLSLLTKSNAIKIFLKDNNICFLENNIETSDLSKIFHYKLKLHFNELFNFGNVGDRILHENGSSLYFLIKVLLFLLEKINLKNLTTNIESNNGKLFLLQSLEI